MAETYDRLETDLRTAERDLERARAEAAVKLLGQARAVLARQTPDAETVSALRVLLR